MENRTFSKMDVSHTYSERDGKIFVRIVGVDENYFYEVPKGQSVEEQLVINDSSHIVIKLSGDINYLYISDREEMSFLEQIAGVKIKYASEKEKKDIEEYKILHKGKTEELRKVCNEQGFLVLTDIEGVSNLERPYALEVVVSGRSFRIYMDINGKDISYQAVDSRNFMSGALRSCKKITTLLKQLKSYKPPAINDADCLGDLK